MSIRRRITTAFLAVNGVTLALLLTYIVLQTGSFRDRFVEDETQMQNRTARLLAMSLVMPALSDLYRKLNEEERNNAVLVRRTISEQDYWDDDSIVQANLEKAALLLYDETSTLLFNPRPRLIFEQGEVEPVPLRELVDASPGVVSVSGREVYGSIELDDKRRWGFFLRLKEPTRVAVDPVESVRAVLFITIPGILLLVVLLYIFFNNAVVARLESMQAAARRIAGGTYDQPVEEAGRDDELDALALAMNRMMQQLAAYRQEMEELVAEATDRFKTAQRHLATAQRLTAMGQMAAGIAHEINNPLSGLLNAVAKLKNPELPPERRERSAGIAENAVRRIEGNRPPCPGNDTAGGGHRRALRSRSRGRRGRRAPAAPLPPRADRV